MKTTRPIWLCQIGRLVYLLTQYKGCKVEPPPVREHNLLIVSICTIIDCMEQPPSSAETSLRKVINSLEHRDTPIEGYEKVSPDWYVIKGEVERKEYLCRNGDTNHTALDAYAKIGEKYFFIKNILAIDPLNRPFRAFLYSKRKEVERDQIPEDLTVKYPDDIAGQNDSRKIRPGYASPNVFYEGLHNDFFVSLNNGDVLLRSNDHEPHEPVFYKKV